MTTAASPPHPPAATGRVSGARLADIAGWAALALAIAAHLAWLLRYPVLHPDEVQNLNWLPAWWDGTWSTTSMDRVFLPVPFVNQGPLGLSALLVIKPFGVGLLQARSVAFAWGLALLAVTYALGRLLYGRAEASVATLILAVSYPFFLSSHLLRGDVALAVIGFGCVALLLVGRRWPPANFLAGLLLPWGEEIHLNIGAFAFGLGLLYLGMYGLTLWRRREAWLFAAGLLVGVLVVLGPLSFGMLEARSQAAGFSVGTSKQPPILAMSLPQALVGEAFVRMAFLFWPGEVDALLVVAALIWSLGHRAPRDRRLLWLGLGMFLFYVLLVRTKAAYYIVEWFPIIALLAASGLRQAAQQARPRRWQPLFAGMAIVVIGLLGANRLLLQMLPTTGYDHRALELPLRQTIPSGASVLGEPHYWLELQDHPYTNWWSISGLWQRDGLLPRAAIVRYRPDAIIVDEVVRSYFGPSPDRGPFWAPILEPMWHPSPLPGTLENILADGYRIGYSGDVEGHGHIVIYLRSPG